MLLNLLAFGNWVKETLPFEIRSLKLTFALTCMPSGPSHMYERGSFPSAANSHKLHWNQIGYPNYRKCFINPLQEFRF